RDRDGARSIAGVDRAAKDLSCARISRLRSNVSRRSLRQIQRMHVPAGSHARTPDADRVYRHGGRVSTLPPRAAASQIMTDADMTTPSELFVGIDVPAKVGGAAFRATLVLRSVCHFDLRKVEGQMFHAVATPQSGCGNRGDDHVFHLDLQVLYR